MPKIQLPIANGFYSSESLPISAQRCINWYPNIVQTQGLSQETLFGIPGMGQFMVQAVFARAFMVVQGAVLVMALAVLSANLITDLAYAWLDPRIRYHE